MISSVGGVCEQLNEVRVQYTEALKQLKEHHEKAKKENEELRKEQSSVGKCFSSLFWKGEDRTEFVQEKLREYGEFYKVWCQVRDWKAQASEVGKALGMERFAKVDENIWSTSKHSCAAGLEYQTLETACVAICRVARKILSTAKEFFHEMREREKILKNISGQKVTAPQPVPENPLRSLAISPELIGQLNEVFEATLDPLLEAHNERVKRAILTARSDPGTLWAVM